MPMEGLKRRLSFRKKKKDKVPECSKPHQWQEDEKKVREGTCSFQVRYLGCVEVFESRGMQVCEEAVKTLKDKCKGKYQRAILYVSGDALRVVDEISKSMIVDQTIEKVSFCAPDRNHEKGFAYICRDGTTRRWMCHGFLAVKESKLWRKQKIKGERLSHAVGCAFAICLERKQKRDKESTQNVTVTYSQDRSTFERMGSFRQTSLTERLTDPQSAILAEPVPVRRVDNPYAVQRPHASDNLLIRQGSFRGFSKLQEASSPFKRTLSLRLNELPSTLQRQNAMEISPPKSAGICTEMKQWNEDGKSIIVPSVKRPNMMPQELGLNNNGVIHEVPSPEKEDSISQMCQQLTQGLSALTEDPFAQAPMQGSQNSHLVKQHSMPATFHITQPVVNHPAPPLHQTNPWGSPGHVGTTTAKIETVQGRASPSTNPFISAPSSTPSPATGTSGVFTTTRPSLQDHKSHSIDTSNVTLWQQQQHAKKQTLLEMAHHQSFQLNGNATTAESVWPTDTDWASSFQQTSTTNTSTQNQSKTTVQTEDTFDPFDVAWAAKNSGGKGPVTQTTNSTSSNPFATKTVTTYKVEL